MNKIISPLIMSTPASDINRPKRELKVLSLGMTRTGECTQLLTSNTILHRKYVELTDLDL